MTLLYTLTLTLPAPASACSGASTLARMASNWLLAG